SYGGASSGRDSWADCAAVTSVRRAFWPKRLSVDDEIDGVDGAGFIHGSDQIGIWIRLNPPRLVCQALVNVEPINAEVPVRRVIQGRSQKRGTRACAAHSETLHVVETLFHLDAEHLRGDCPAGLEKIRGRSHGHELEADVVSR